MRHHRFFTLLAVGLLALFPVSAFADLATQQIVTNFNSMNNGKGYLFQSTTSNNYFGQFSGENRLVNQGTDTPDLSGYSIGVTANNGTGTNFYFQTFCVEPERTLYENEVTSGKLNYNESAGTSTTSYGNSLKLGVAYLYMKFADGSLSGYNYTLGTSRANSAVLLQDAIWFLMGKTDNLIVSTTNWTTNAFLQQLYNLNSDVNYWLAAYDPSSNYGGLMEDAKVYVVQTSFDSLLRSPELVRQDVLYVTRTGGGDVPEPASILLWTLGSLGAAGAAYRKRRKATK